MFCFSSPTTPVNLGDTPETPPTPPTVRQRKSAPLLVSSPNQDLPSSPGVITELTPPRLCRAAASPEQTEERLRLVRTKSLPPVPKLELTCKEMLLCFRSFGVLLKTTDHNVTRALLHFRIIRKSS